MASCVRTHGTLAYGIRMHCAMACCVRIHIACAFRVGSGMCPARVRPERPERLVRLDTACASGYRFFFLMHPMRMFISALIRRQQLTPSASTNRTTNTPDEHSPTLSNSTCSYGGFEQYGVPHTATSQATTVPMLWQSKVQSPATPRANTQPLQRLRSWPKQDPSSSASGKWNSPSPPHRSNSQTTSAMSNGKRHVQYGMSYQTAPPQTHNRINLMTCAAAGRT